MNRSLLYMMLFLFLSGCNNNNRNDDEPGNMADVDPGSIWFDYQVWGEEGNDSVTVKLQYRYGEAGPTLLIDEPAKVELDGKPVPGNSSKITGPYYEVRYPVSTFAGDHVINFTNREGKRYREKFTFQPFLLKAEIPDTIKRGTIVFKLQGLSPGGYVRVLMTDTAYASEGIDRLDTVNNGQIIITGSDLAGLANGPIQLELIRENDSEINNGTFEGGRISIRYGLRKEFILAD